MQATADRQKQTSKQLQIFSQRLRSRRHRLDWTIEELAEKSAIAPRSIGAWEKGPQSKLLAQLADTLGVSIFWLLGEEESAAAGPGGTTEAERAVLAYVQEILTACQGNDARVNWLLCELQDKFPKVRFAAGANSAPLSGAQRILKQAGERYDDAHPAPESPR